MTCEKCKEADAWLAVRGARLCLTCVRRWDKSKEKVLERAFHQFMQEGKHGSRTSPA